jgi:hypothetical protein
MKHVVLDLHDFSVANNRLDLLLKIKDKYPSFKVSMFTVPFDKRGDWGPSLIHDDNLKRIHKNLDWIQIIPHGLEHLSRSEIEHYDYESFIYEAIPKITQKFNEDELPFVRGFCAPHWRWSDGVVKALDDMGWWGAVLREDKIKKTKRFYRYNYLLNERFWESEEEILKLHGHVYGTKNDIGKCLDNIMKLPEDVEWHYATDFIENERI